MAAKLERTKEELFENYSIPRAVAVLSVPTMLSSLVMVLYSLADTYFVGMLNDPVQTAAVTLASPVLLAFNAINNLFGVGSSSMMSRAMGRKDLQTVRRSSTLGFWGALLCGGPASSEGRMHLAIYAALPQTRAVLHTHPPRLLALSLRLAAKEGENWRDAFLSLPLFEARTWRQRLAFAPALPPGTPELARAVAQAAQTAPAVWMEGHGLCCHGENPAFCLDLSEHLEHLAGIQLESMGAC